MIPEPSLDYLAGFFDGEGTITITRQFPRPHHYTRWALVSRVSSTDRDILTCFANRYGGQLTIQRTLETPRRPNAFNPTRTCWEWQISAQQTIAFIESILPYLRIKRPQALLALEFQERLRHGQHVTLDEGHHRDKLCLAMWDLNRPTADNQSRIDARPLHLWIMDHSQ